MPDQQLTLNHVGPFKLRDRSSSSSCTFNTYTEPYVILPELTFPLEPERDGHPGVGPGVGVPRLRTAEPEAVYNLSGAPGYS